MKILKKISKVIVIVMAVLATIWCGLYVYANYFYNDKQIDVENFYIAELPLPPSQFEEDFKEIHQIVMENYSLYQAKHLNMESLYQACDARLTMRPRHYLLQEVHSQSARSLYRGFLVR